ncbi:MAG TPA: response regulator [Rhizomicrobium sp.]|nr:response regulator [Rhizomicrobium sp.]
MTAARFENLKALIVEDNAHMRALLRTLLGGIGISEVHEAGEGGRAFALLERLQPDFVLTDLTMAPVDGIAFTRELRTSHASPNPYVPVIMVTGHTERERVTAARDAGVTELLAKPVTARNLFLRLAAIVDRPRPFVRSEDFFGPDRRRHNDAFYMGPWRRAEDRERDVALL